MPYNASKRMTTWLARNRQRHTLSRQLRLRDQLVSAADLTSEHRDDLIRAIDTRWTAELKPRLATEALKRIGKLRVWMLRAVVFALQPSLQIESSRHQPATPAELARFDCVVTNSRSQFREDLLMLPLLLNATGLDSPGTFVELGAFDGLDSSNSLLYERCFGWRGLLIEANPRNYAKLRRSGRTSRMVHSAICGAESRSERRTLPMLIEGLSVASLVDLVDNISMVRWSNRWRLGPEWCHGQRCNASSRGSFPSSPSLLRQRLADPTATSEYLKLAPTVSVPCQSLRSLMSESWDLFGREPRATFLSLDVE